MATYVISDIHGRREEFYEMLVKIEFDKNDKLYILGDVVDRGPDGLALLLEIMDMTNVEMIIGNHEQMALEHFKTEDFEGYEATHWRIVNGGHPTYQEWRQLTEVQKNKVVDFITHLPTHKILHINGCKYCLVHGGLIPIAGFTVEELIKQQEKKLTWTREAFYGAKTRFEDCVVIAGHTPTENIDQKFKGHIWGGVGMYQDRILIDCGATILGCLRLEDREVFYV